MGWLDQSREVRAARRDRRVRVRRRVQTNEARLWDDKEKSARDDRARAAVEYDFARSCIAKTADPVERARLYRALHQTLEQFNRTHGWRKTA